MKCRKCIDCGGKVKPYGLCETCPKVYDYRPTEDEIAERAAVIRNEWSDKEERRRRAVKYQPATVARSKARFEI